MNRFLAALVLLASPAAFAQQSSGLALALHQAVAGACGNCVVGVSIGDPGNPATWRLDYVPDATAAQQAQAQAALAGFDLSAFTAQQAAATALAQKIAEGIQIQSSSMSALNGTYAIDPPHQQQVASVSLYIAVNGKFPAGQFSLAWPDINGTPHSFPTTAEFQAFATVLGDYVAALELGQSPAQPSTMP